MSLICSKDFCAYSLGIVLKLLFITVSVQKVQSKLIHYKLHACKDLKSCFWTFKTLFYQVLSFFFLLFFALDLSKLLSELEQLQPVSQNKDIIIIKMSQNLLASNSWQ